MSSRLLRHLNASPLSPSLPIGFNSPKDTIQTESKLEHNFRKDNRIGRHNTFGDDKNGLFVKSYSIKEHTLYSEGEPVSPN